MDMTLNSYLKKVEKYLSPLPVSERADIVKEIESEMLELQANGKAAEEIVARLGEPRELAKAYLRDLISQSKSLSWTRITAICAYYSLVSLTGMIVIPTLAICAPVFIVSAIATPVLAIIKLIDSLLHLGIPYVNYIVMLGIENPILAFILSILTGAVLYLIGRGCWKLLISYIKAIDKTKRRLSI